MKKVLFVAHVDSHIRHFHLPYLKYFKDKGYEVHVATSNDENEMFPNCDVKHTISFRKNPLKFQNIEAVSQMKKLLKTENFELIHCHTPIGGVVTRLACKNARKNGTKVLYTAHGFHFYKGSSLMSWVIFYSIEKLLSRRNDVLITINNEDYELAKKRFYTKEIKMIHGVGVDDKKFNTEPLDKFKEKELKDELDISDNDFVLMYVAELNKNKNQIILINAINKIIKEYPNIKLFLIGNGTLFNFYSNKIREMKLEKNIKLLGYRKDINELLKIADLYVASSIREGLGLNLIEAALTGIAVLAKRNRGHLEIVKENVNGLLFESDEELFTKLKELYLNKTLLKHLSDNSRSSVMKFSLKNSYEEQVKIYEDVLQFK